MLEYLNRCPWAAKHWWPAARSRRRLTARGVAPTLALRGRAVPEPSAPPAPPEPPTGTVTFLFTDLEGSTRLLEAHPAAYREAVRRHHALLREAVEAHGGAVFETVGDAVYAAFARPTDAVRGGPGGAAGPAAGGLGGDRRAPGAHGRPPGGGGAPGGPLLRGAPVPLRPPDGHGPRGAGGAVRGGDGPGAGRPAGGRRACATWASTASRTCSARSASSSSCTPTCPAAFPPLAHAGRPARTTCRCSPRRFVGREREVAAVRARLLAPGVRAADPDRPRRGGQDAPGPAGGGRGARRLPRRGLVRRPGAPGRPGAGAAGRGPGAGRAGGRRAGRWRRRCATTCAPGACCWCWTTASTSCRAWRPRSPPCWRRAPGSRSWPPAGRPCGWRGSTSTPCPRCALPPRPGAAGGARRPGGPVPVRGGARCSSSARWPPGRGSP